MSPRVTGDWEASEMGMSKHRKMGHSGPPGELKQMLSREANRAAEDAAKMRRRQGPAWFRSVRELFDSMKRGAR